MRTPREKLIIKVIGCDGSQWTISGGAENGAGKEGVWLDKAHVGMITDAPVETVWESSATQVGATYRDTTYLPRDITVPVGILDSPERSWQLVDSRWRMAWSTARDSTIVVIDPATGSRREVKARLYRTPEPFMIDDLSGHQKGSSGLAMYLRSGDPLYSSMEETDVWRFNGINYVGHVTVSNPTDVAMPPQWVMKGPGDFILPDFSFETREGWPFYEHRDRRIVMPFQKIGTDVTVDLTDGQEQVAARGMPNYWQLMNGQFFLHKVPPWTPPTKIPVVVNPIPWLPTLWHRFGIPFEIPAEALVQIAQRLSNLLAPIGTDTVLSWTPERLAQEIDQAIRQVLPNFLGDWVDILLQVLNVPTIGEIIAEAWGSVANMAGAGVQLRQQRKWTRPYGLEM